MKDLLLLKKIIGTTMLVSVGIWIGMGVSTYSERISFTVHFIVFFFLIPICAFSTLWLHHYEKKLKRHGKNKETFES